MLVGLPQGDLGGPGARDKKEVGSYHGSRSDSQTDSLKPKEAMQSDEDADSSHVASLNDERAAHAAIAQIGHVDTSQPSSISILNHLGIPGSNMTDAQEIEDSSNTHAAPNTLKEEEAPIEGHISMSEVAPQNDQSDVIRRDAPSAYIATESRSGIYNHEDVPKMSKSQFHFRKLPRDDIPALGHFFEVGTTNDWMQSSTLPAQYDVHEVQASQPLGHFIGAAEESLNVQSEDTDRSGHLFTEGATDHWMQHKHTSSQEALDWVIDNETKDTDAIPKKTSSPAGVEHSQASLVDTSQVFLKTSSTSNQDLDSQSTVTRLQGILAEPISFDGGQGVDLTHVSAGWGTVDSELDALEPSSATNADIGWLQSAYEQQATQLPDSRTESYGSFETLVPVTARNGSAPAQAVETDLGWLHSSDGAEQFPDEAQSELSRPPEDIEDSWSKAFAATDDLVDLDSSWNAFAADLEDDGLLEEPVPQLGDSTTPMSSPRYAPTSSNPPFPRRKSSNSFGTSSTYNAAFQLQSAIPPQTVASAKPMEFFAELPSSKIVRSRKPQRPMLPQTQSIPSPPAPPPTQAPPISARHSSSTAPYQNFTTPNHMELFPPQPSVPPPTFSTTTSITPVMQPTPPATSRYSPAPVQPTTKQSYLSQAPQNFARATPPMSGLQPPPNLPPIAGSRSQSPYAPSPAANGSQSSYAKPPKISKSYISAAPTPAASTGPRPGTYLSQQQDPTMPGRFSTIQPNQEYGPAGQPLQQPLQNASIMANPYMNRETTVSPDILPPLAPLKRFAPRTSSPLAQSRRPSVDRTMTMPFQRQETVQPDHARQHSQEDILVQNNLSLPKPGPPVATSRYSPSMGSSLVGAGFAFRQPLATVPEPGCQTSFSDPLQMTLGRPKTSSPERHAPKSAMDRTPYDRPASASVGFTQSYGHSLQNEHFRPQQPSREESDFVIPTDETAYDPLQRWRGRPIITWSLSGTVTTCLPKSIPIYSGGVGAPKLKPIPGDLRVHRLDNILSDTAGVLAFPGPLNEKSKKARAVLWLESMIKEMEHCRDLLAPDRSAHEKSRASEKVLLWQTVKIFVESDGTLYTMTPIFKGEHPVKGNKAVDSLKVPEKAVFSPKILELFMLPPQVVEVTVSSTSPQLQIQQSRQAIILEIKQNLLDGRREDATWLAANNHLWSHAMLIASNCQDIPELWNQVVREFVAKDVRSREYSTRSLATLYKVFSGDWQESVNELVDSFTLREIESKTAEEIAHIPVELKGNVDKWSETLRLILNNPSKSGLDAIQALGDLLLKFRRVEAAHICFILSRLQRDRGEDHFGAPRDLEVLVNGETTGDLSSFTPQGFPGQLQKPETGKPKLALVGLDHAFEYDTASATRKLHDTMESVNLESILLSEAYEFGLLLEASDQKFFKPHMQAYKLQHAYVLSELGNTGSGKDLSASQICKAIIVNHELGLKDGRTRAFHHMALHERASSLAAMLDSAKQSKQGGSRPGVTSLFSTQTLSSVFNMATLNNGLESLANGPEERPSVPSNGTVDGYLYNASGPLAHSSQEGTPYVSRSASVADFASLQYQSSQASAISGSRYVPPSFTPRQSLDHDSAAQGLNSYSSSPEQRIRTYSPRMSLDSNVPSYGSPPNGRSYFSPRQSSQLSQNPYPPTPLPKREDGVQGAYQPSLLMTSTAPGAPYNERMGFQSGATAEDESHEQFNGNGYAHNSSPMYGGYQPQAGQHDDQISLERSGPSSYEPSRDTYQPSGGYEPPQDSYEPSGGYEPPTGSYGPDEGGHAPPSYQTEANVAPKDEPPKMKKRFGDDDADDDDDDPVAHAEELKKKERAQRDKEADEAFRKAAEEDAARGDKKVKRQSSGWFGGISLWKQRDPSAPTVHKAKLGEESSFYYDEQTKKWVNRKADPATATQSSPIPPPPPRVPPGGSAPPSRNANSAGPPQSRPPTTGGERRPLPSSFPVPSASNPPSRTDSPADQYTSGTGLELQNGPPTAAPPSRPATSMSTVSNASSLDDLMGPVQARKGGTLKKAKKRGGYVDVLANK